MGMGKNPSSCHGTEREPFKVEVKHASVSWTQATDASKEHKSDLTIEKGNPISHRGVYFTPPVPSKISRPRSPASDINVMSKRRAINYEETKPSALYQSPCLPVQHNQQTVPSNTYVGTHSSNNKYLTSGSYFSRNHGFLNDSLPRSSVSGYWRPETNVINYYSHHSGPSFVSAPEILSYSWENSVPFRPSFTLPKIDSLSQTPYDPLVDSVHPSDNADSEEMNISPENSPVAVSNNLSGIGENSPDYIQCNYLCKDKPKMAPLEEALDEVNSSKDQTDRSWPGQPSNKVMAELKMFRVALTEFIKELVKPAWKSGILSIDAHRMLVKKASDKIVSSVQPHQALNSPESVKQYISTYKPKIEKLVEGYLEMYHKKNSPTVPKNEVSCIGSSA